MPEEELTFQEIQVMHARQQLESYLFYKLNTQGCEPEDVVRELESNFKDQALLWALSVLDDFLNGLHIIDLESIE